ncbi:MAG: extracellular solute-binding protein [Gomphosphaeria aponina SAG 52.96 = DSM 107014]|uniref:Extracellular solute-binding protein n=1 Tax=Gomphosphaeria aponina SAG 52.96 = DSM 107014 TaxID=1521640 RepID=A0A941GXJ5_9CHRO|nr:extracellular solute-binding protein [Gomphosphaeria aponina SAG 52.96 = DSM 107014]
MRKSLLPLGMLLLLSACNNNPGPTDSILPSPQAGLEVKFLVGSDLGEFCNQTAAKLNNTQPKTDDGQAFYLTCVAQGSGDVVNTMLTQAQQLQQGTLKPESPEFPTLLSVDGEIYQSQLIYQMDKIFPGQNYIPEITDSPLIAYSPMVFMTTSDLAPGLEKVDNPYLALANFDNHNQLDSNAQPLPINYVHTAPTRSNSGLQTLVAQFASLAGKPPEQLTVADVQQYQDEVQKIQSKITRYGISTNSLAESMVKNGPFWASVGSVYESSVINANSGASQTKYQAIYPAATFSSNKRAILPNAPWVSAAEKEAGEKVIEFMRSPEIQQMASELGLRPGVPGVALSAKFSPQFGVNPNPNYESYRPAQPEVVEAMLKSWQVSAKKPSLVAVVVDTSGSMQGEKMTAVQNTLLNYVNNLGPKETIAIISFNSQINEPVIVEGTPAGKAAGIKFISSLAPGGGTRLYDSALFARNWLQSHLRPEAINAVLILTDGEDSESQISLEQLEQELQKSGFSTDVRIGFFTVGYGNEGEFNPAALEKIAQVNGGYYKKGDPATISNLMADLQVEF